MASDFGVWLLLLVVVGGFAAVLYGMKLLSSQLGEIIQSLKALK